MPIMDMNLSYVRPGQADAHVQFIIPTHNIVMIYYSSHNNHLLTFSHSVYVPAVLYKKISVGDKQNDYSYTS